MYKVTTRRKRIQQSFRSSVIENRSTNITPLSHTASSQRTELKRLNLAKEPSSASHPNQNYINIKSTNCPANHTESSHRSPAKESSNRQNPCDINNNNKSINCPASHLESTQGSPAKQPSSSSPPNQTHINIKSINFPAIRPEFTHTQLKAVNSTASCTNVRYRTNHKTHLVPILLITTFAIFIAFPDNAYLVYHVLGKTPPSTLDELFFVFYPIGIISDALIYIIFSKEVRRFLIRILRKK